MARYECLYCDFVTSNKSKYDDHKSGLKHANTVLDREYNELYEGNNMLRKDYDEIKKQIKTLTPNKKLYIEAKRLANENKYLERCILKLEGSIAEANDKEEETFLLKSKYRDY
jgi:hypothetical protein